MARLPEPELPADVATLHGMIRELRAALAAATAVPAPAEQPAPPPEEAKTRRGRKKAPK